ncbi:efflux transporter outer membrane subunit [Pedobacter cryotolerans]|uniref:Efflux transporter outer membrane subunit n=1 Tax=Pedobacter cryotolerans TaxID=2571270 RepID=A0A4U1C3H0_9SPHI|nr:efflux transporter outer membrane subunit [Pedobacter cryotolerans]TKB99893.1 efflux transporter outer membrane subunit [Pedobacter cryotolerans]
MKKIINNVFAILILILASCGITKDIATPIKDVPINFRGTEDNQTSSIGTLSVKDFFNNATLQQLIDTALLRNLDIQIALQNIEAADLMFKRAKLGQLPRLNFQASVNSNRPSSNSLNGLSTSQFLNTNHIEDFNANLALSWEADIWGKIAKQKEATYATYLQTEEVKKAVQTRVVAQVATTFYQLIMLDAQLKVANSNVEFAANTVKMIKMQYDAGQVTSLAIQQAEAQKLQASQLIPQILREISIQENGLSALSGKFPSAVERSLILAQINIPEQLAVGVPSAMLSIRPDVKSAELALKIANANVGVANAKLYPSLIISASGGLNSFKASNWFNIPASLFGIVGGGITQPLLNSKELKTQFHISKIEREKSVMLFRQTVIGAVAEVANEQAKIINLKSEYIIAQNRVATLQLAVKNSDLLFKSGMANYLEVIAAQGNLLQGELDLTSLKTAQLNTSVLLYKALGGGWQ